MGLTIIYKGSQQDDVLAAIKKLEEKVMTTIAEFKADFDAKIAQLGTSLDNIAADEKGLQDQLAKVLASQNVPTDEMAILQEMSTSLGAMVQRSQTVADSIPDAPASAA